jgi:antitoxin component YwqK of YwqJK toxin-antitoxin module
MNTYTLREDYPNNMRIVRTYSSNDSMLLSEKIYQNNILVESNEHIDKNNIRYSIQRKFYTNGTLSEFSEFIGNRRVGYHKKFFENGNIEFFKSYNNYGDLHGSYRIYDIDGSMTTSRHYVNGNIMDF